MATKQDFDALQSEYDSETTRIGNYITELIAKQQAGGMTAEEEQSVLDGFKAAAARLKALGTSTTPPELPPIS